MIVLDEHLQGVGLERSIRQWYRGRVCVVTELRPGTGVKDDSISQLLRTAVQPTFVTLNWTDFWEQTAPHQDFCLVCLTLSPGRVTELPMLLRRLLRSPAFKTKAARMGKVARVSGDQVTYRQVHDNRTYVIPLP